MLSLHEIFCLIEYGVETFSPNTDFSWDGLGFLCTEPAVSEDSSMVIKAWNSGCSGDQVWKVGEEKIKNCLASCRFVIGLVNSKVSC